MSDCSNTSQKLEANAMPHFSVVAGSNIGYLKGVCFSKRTYFNLNSNFGDSDRPSRDANITSMCWGNSDESSILAGRLGGDILHHDLASGTFNFIKLNREDGDGNLKAIRYHDSSLITALSNGIVKIFDLPQCTDISSGIDPQSQIISFTDKDQKQLDCMDFSLSSPSNIVTGGKENSLKVWDINMPQTPIFQSKNPKNDWLNLRVPVWFTKAQFYQDSGKVVSGTGYGDVRLYDPQSSQRRPVIEVKCGEHPLTGFCVRPNSDFQIYIGDTTGFTASVDLRKKAIIRKFKGTKGGITDIKAHPKYPLFIASSVDRFVYCYEPDGSRNCIYSVYLKNSLNCLLCSSSWHHEDYSASSARKEISQSNSKNVAESSGMDTESEQSDSDFANEDEADWNTMEVIGDKRKSQVKTKAEVSKRKVAKRIQ